MPVLDERGRRSLFSTWRWMLLGMPLVSVAVAAFGAGLDSPFDSLLFGALGLVYRVALGPLLWLRWFTNVPYSQPLRRRVELTGLAAAWAVGGVAVLWRPVTWLG